jgi:uncharacterized membrane protein
MTPTTAETHSTTYTQFLRSVSLFALLDEQELAALEPNFEPESVKAGESIFRYGDHGDKLYIVQTGSVELWVNDNSGDKIVLATSGPGDVFGELSLFDLGTRSANATALEDCHLLVLTRDHLLLFIKANPNAALDLLAVMARKLRETDYLLMGRVTRNLNTAFEEKISPVQRLANWIAEFSGSMPFLFMNAAIFFVWIILNVNVIPGFQAFDPYPFGFLTMSVSLEAIFLSIFVLLAQNLQAAKDRLRSDVEYEVNLKAELEVAELHEKIHQLKDDVARRFISLEQKLTKG